MEKLIGKDIQNKCLKILESFDAFALEHKLTYYMSGGTLLGAVRHNGFIPWDDDVDLMMPRKDYEQLIKEFRNDQYQLSCCENDSDYSTPFVRIWDTKTTLRWNVIDDKQIGAFIDIFPIDGFPKNEMITKLHLYSIKWQRVKLHSSIRRKYLVKEKYQGVKSILKLLIRKSGNYYANRLNIVSKRYKYDDCLYVGVKTTSVHLFKEKNSKEIFKETIYFPFEHLKLPAPSGYDAYLRHLYGEYMVLPSEDQRYSEHNFEVYEINQ